MWSAAVAAALISLLSAAAAQARPSFDLVEASARAGDVVHFHISGAEGGVSYELELDGDYLLDGAADGDVFGSFTVPDLGGEAWSPIVEANLRWGGRRRTQSGQLDYLGHALPVAPAPAAAAPAAGGDTGDQDAPTPAPTSAATTPARTSPGAVSKRRSRRPQHGRSRRAPKSPRHAERSTEPRRSVHRGRHRPKHGAKHRHPRSRHAGRHIKGFFKGYAEPGPGVRPDAPEGASDPKANAPQTAKPAATAGGGSLSGAALVVPSVLGLAALALAATAVLRKRRLIPPRRRA